MSAVKINWGYKITGLYLGFMAIIITLVVSSFHQSFDMVSDDYYQKELAYQDVLDAGKNQATLSEPAHIYANETALIIDFPPELKGKSLSGKVQLYSPVDASWDKVVAINTSANSMTVPRSELKNTKYTVKISWASEGKSYYQESDINLYQ